MTGIEQLRKLGADAVRGGEVGRAICDIADQIERERECERDTIENLRLELGEARDHAADVSTSAYDLLPQEDREAIAWVREHGGLGAVRDSIKTNEWALSLAIIAHDALFGVDFEGDVTPTEFKRELDRRLMPEGMEWPRFEDSEPVRIGDEVCGGGRAFIVDHVVLFSDGESTVCAEADMGSGKVRDYVRVRPSYRLKRPESKCRDCAHWQKDPTADKMGVCWFFYHEHEGEDCYAARLGDIDACEEFMPRASALAERERGE